MKKVVMMNKCLIILLMLMGLCGNAVTHARCIDPLGNAVPYLKTTVAWQNADIVATIQNTGTKPRHLTGLVFLPNEAGYHFRIQLKQSGTIIDAQALAGNQHGFVSSAYVDSRIYFDSDIPTITLAPNQAITIRESTAHILHAYPSLLAQLSPPRTAVRVMFSLQEPAQQLTYHCYSDWLHNQAK